MTLFDHSTHRSTDLEKLDVWRCADGCGFHVRAGSVILTFTEHELAAFLRAAGGCYLGEDRAHVESRSEHVAGYVAPDADFPDPADAADLTSTLEH